MFIVKGKYNEAKIFASEDEVEQSAIGQIKALCNQEFVRDSRIRLMPDLHAGKGSTIGTAMTVSSCIVPYLVGADIGCGMETVKLKEKRLNLPKLDKVIREQIPSGKKLRSFAHKYLSAADLDALRCREHVDLKRAGLSLGTLGSGNHFIEVSADDEGSLYLVVHSGSRYLGLQTAQYYQDQGYKCLQQKNPESQETATALKGKGGEEAEPLKLHQDPSLIPYELAYVSGELFEDYVHDMQIVQHYALLNRKAMVHEIISALNLKVQEQFSTIHNYLDTEQMILRKGAVSAQKGEKILIPINMRDGSLICEGLGNEDWNFSAPHGAGRLMDRSTAKSSFTVHEFKRQMQGIYSTSVGRDTLDECPMAYKSSEQILKHIAPTAKVLKTIKPIYNFKAG